MSLLNFHANDPQNNQRVIFNHVHLVNPVKKPTAFSLV
jgi:hypothetical protein